MVQVLDGVLALSCRMVLLWSLLQLLFTSIVGPLGWLMQLPRSLVSLAWAVSPGDVFAFVARFPGWAIALGAVSRALAHSYGWAVVPSDYIAGSSVTCDHVSASVSTMPPPTSSSSPVATHVVSRPHTRNRSGISLPKERTDGIVAWLAACLSQAVADPTAESRHYSVGLQIPHWWHAMELEYHALLKNDTWIHVTVSASAPRVTMYFLVYVDDITLVSSSATAADRLVSSLGTTFAVKDLGKLHYFLGLEVTHNDTSLSLTQKKYSHDLLRRAGMLQCKPATTPMSTLDQLTAVDGPLLSSEDAKEYHSFVGGLQYLTITRPDISYA
ncbi:hypothetical protein QYE76_071055 [Lolium multiflorum]|uniref:Reverse transcriptase Ty1/copia-type domain-containing protein n=1 Tax=Lolium multiflorum TaxID=4521 RepID=A0AAD8SLN0_LOLMU|nr:hypothetical protein QYE76_071055 [Lolium multiflorum]